MGCSAKWWIITARIAIPRSPSSVGRCPVSVGGGLSASAPGASWRRSVLRPVRVSDYGHPARFQGFAAVFQHILRPPDTEDFSALLRGAVRGAGAAAADRSAAAGG